MSGSGSRTVINYGSGSDFLTSYGSGSGSGSTSQKVTVPTVPVPVPVPQHCLYFDPSLESTLNRFLFPAVFPKQTKFAGSQLAFSALLLKSIKELFFTR